MNILVTGANGQLGNEMRLISRTSPHKFVFTDVVEQAGVETIYLDITDIEAVRAIVARESIDAIVNCVAYNNVEKAEEEQETCALLNVKGPENLAVTMKEADGLIVHISSDYVFGGSLHNVPCREEDDAVPVNVYGRTKLQGEQAVQATGADHVVIRTAWLYSEFGRNFVKTMLSLTSSRPEISVVFDQTGTPTYALDLAEAIHAVLEDYASENSDEPYARSGLYHFTDEGVCSWYDLAVMTAGYAGQTSCRIRPCHSDEFPSKVTRPAYSVLDKTRIKETFGISIPHWTESLKKCISSILSQAQDI